MTLQDATLAYFEFFGPGMIVSWDEVDVTRPVKARGRLVDWTPKMLAALDVLRQGRTTGPVLPWPPTWTRTAVSWSHAVRVPDPVWKRSVTIYRKLLPVRGDALAIARSVFFGRVPTHYRSLIAEEPIEVKITEERVEPTPDQAKPVLPLALGSAPAPAPPQEEAVAEQVPHILRRQILVIRGDLYLSPEKGGPPTRLPENLADHVRRRVQEQAGDAKPASVARWLASAPNATI